MASDHDPFYVGYLPTPAPHRRFVRAAFVAVLFIATAAGAGLAWLMDDPGDAVWQSETTSVEGTLRLDPVPFLVTVDGPVLLVEIGKFGARDLTAIGDGARVTASGLLLSRGEHRMLELSADADAISATSGAQAAAAPTTASRGVTVIGEIIDTKCYLGAMKPGRGKTHAACARLCIRGGIPAGIVGTADGEPIWAVIDPGATGIIPETLLNAVGETVTLEGNLVTIEGLAVVRGARLADPG